MPSSINDIFSNTSTIYKGVVKWGDRIPSSQSGVYAVTLTLNPNTLDELLNYSPIDPEIVRMWVANLPQFSLDDAIQPNYLDVVERLKKFWLPDEYIIYIGKATNLRSRVGQYYRTPLGVRKPHAGGHWIKTLKNLSSMYIHYGLTNQPKIEEAKMLKYFIDNISPDTRNKLFDHERPFPFANLEYPQGTRKRHGIGKSKQ